ncbi:unnamed protein product [Cylicocyclus nassatus]|uniref:Transmembrane protein n=1 Tax=Cylicocyclus nassatus TaxID=53992 RepID=A0AA36M7W1_CYLNA|nr:unnamed protein product [Cylicocyclus nassatus]
MDKPVDPNRTVYGVVICVSAAACILLLYMALFGRRMPRTAIRWHVINCSWWSLIHLASYGSYAEKAPWPEYIKLPGWSENARGVELFSRSIFPCGIFFVYIEMMILVCVPRLIHNWVFNLIFFILVVPVLNFIVLFCFFAKWMAVEWFYRPIDFLNIFTYFLFCIMTLIYFIFCLFGTCLCCHTVTSRRKQNRSVYTFVDMWLLFIYGLIPNIMYGPSFGFTSVEFVFKFFSDWFEQISGGGEGEGEGGLGGIIDMSMIFHIMTGILNALPWLVLLFPLVQVILAIICIKSFRQQFFFLFTCGRVYSGSPAKTPNSEKERALEGSTQSLPGSIETVMIIDEKR